MVNSFYVSSERVFDPAAAHDARVFLAGYAARDNTADSMTSVYSPDYIMIMGGATRADETYFGISHLLK